MKQLLLIALLFCAAGLPAMARGIQADSLRLEYIDGKAYIIHAVDEGETLYSISKRYNCSMNDIAEATPEVKKGLYNGMILKVPYNENAQPATPQQREHVVEKGQTLYSISQLYDVSVIDIMEWNDLMSSDLEVGQKLKIKGVPAEPVEVSYVLDGMRIHVVQPGEGLYAIARQYNVSVDELVEWNELTSSGLNLGQELIVEKNVAKPVAEETELPVTQETTPPVNEKSSPPVIVKSEATEKDRSVNEQTDALVATIDSSEAAIDEPKRVPPPVKSTKHSENGLAAAIEGMAEDGTYLALHRTIPVGSLAAVRNEMNNQVVFVRIVGVLPDTGVNEKIIVRLSPSAVKQIHAIDPRFRVEISYLVPDNQ